MNKETHRIRLENLNADLQFHPMHYNADMRLRILYLVETGISIEYAAGVFGISSRTIRNWQKRYDKDGQVGRESKPKPGRMPHVPDEDIKECITEVQNEGILTVERLQSKIEKRFKVSYATSSIRYILAKHKMTYKAANPVHARGATNEEDEDWRKKHIPDIEKKRAKGYKIFSVDEAHAKIDPDSRHGYAPCGVRVYATYHGKKQNVGIIGAVGEFGHFIFRTAKVFDQWSFMSFLDDFARMLGPGKAVLLLDGARYHDSKMVRKWFDGHPRIERVFLPTGSPHMNYVENVWGPSTRT